MPDGEPLFISKLEDYWNWLKDRQEMSWRGFPIKEEYAVLDKALLDDPRFLDFQLGDVVAELEVATGAYEKVFKIKEGDVVLDLGAHIGYFTKVAASKARVYAVEPSPRNIQKLRQLALSNVTVLPVAAWHTSGVIQFRLSQSSIEGAVVPTVGAWQVPSPMGDIQVLALAIDDLGLEKLDFIKVDIEGAECEALEGARKTILKCKPVIVMETGEVERMKALLDSLGYEIVGIQTTMVAEPVSVTELVPGLWHCKAK